MQLSSDGNIKSSSKVPTNPQEKNKQTNEKKDCVGDAISSKASWKAYTRGNIVSRHAARLIASVPTMTLARSNDFGPEADEDEVSD